MHNHEYLLTQLQYKQKPLSGDPAGEKFLHYFRIHNCDILSKKVANNMEVMVRLLQMIKTNITHGRPYMLMRTYMYQENLIGIFNTFSAEISFNFHNMPR